MSRTSATPVWLGAVALIMTACTGPAPSTTRPVDQPVVGSAAATARTKSITVGITSNVPAMSIVVFGTPAGGWPS